MELRRDIKSRLNVTTGQTPKKAFHEYDLDIKVVDFVRLFFHAFAVQNGPIYSENAAKTS